jgi:hypothetical protein
LAAGLEEQMRRGKVVTWKVDFEPHSSDRRTRKGGRAKRLFLCYSSKDIEFVRRLAADLSVIGVHPWLDQWELSPGDSLHDLIGKAIAETAYLAVVISPHSVESTWCQAELNSALARERQLKRKFVIPLVYRAAKVPTFLLDKVHINCSEDYFRGIARLAGMMLRISRRLLDQSLASDAYPDLPSTIRNLERCGGAGMIDLPNSLVHGLRKELRRHGHVLGREFAIIPDIRRRGGRGGGGPVAC